MFASSFSSSPNAALLVFRTLVFPHYLHSFCSCYCYYYYNRYDDDDDDMAKEVECNVGEYNMD